MSAQLHLPPNATFDIIDHLSEDTETLLTCSLVSLAWMARSRAHAFYSVDVISTTRLRSFFDLLRGGKHSFRFCVQKLFIGFGSCDIRMGLKRSDLVLLLGKLPTLLSIILKDVSWVDDSGVTPRSLSYTPLHLKSLKLLNLTVGDNAISARGLSSVIRLFSGVDLFCIYWDADVKFSTDAVVAPLASAKTIALPKLGELALMNSPMSARTLKWLGNIGICNSLTALAVYVADESTLIALGQLLRLSGQSLKVVTIYLFHNKGLCHLTPDRVARTLEALNCSSIQFFNFWVVLEESFKEALHAVRWQWDAGLAIARQLPKDTLRRLQVTVVPRSTKLSEALLLSSSISWKQLKQTTRLFPRLREVDIVSTPAKDECIAHSALLIAQLSLEDMTTDRMELNLGLLDHQVHPAMM